MIVQPHKDVLSGALPRDLEDAYAAGDTDFIRVRIHELAAQINEAQDDREFHPAAAKLHVAISLYDSLKLSYGCTTLMLDYLNV